MLPRVFDILANDSNVTGLVGDRIYRHGDAPQKVLPPYITWFVVTGTPENALDEAPRIDANRVQVDCWSKSDTEVEQIAVAVRDAIELHYNMTAFSDAGRDPTTMRYRFFMSFTFWTDRP